MFLGKGSYGQVTIKRGCAVKKFAKLSHLIQEYIALKYLNTCQYVVHEKGVNFSNLELSMELYDNSLRNWLRNQRSHSGIPKNTKLKIIHDILMGLIELHDRELAHGDLKPGNILINTNPFKIVLGDCGFVSIYKYSKVDRTAAVYRDPIVDHDLSHDMFSFGICFLEIMYNLKINRQADYKELKEIINNKVDDPYHRKLLKCLLSKNKEQRYTSRETMIYLFNESPRKWDKDKNKTKVLKTIPNNVNPGLSNKYTSIGYTRVKRIYKLTKELADVYDIHRGKTGFSAIITFLQTNNIHKKYHSLFIHTNLMILSALFGESGYREEEVIENCDKVINLSHIYQTLYRLLSDTNYIKILLCP